MKARYRVTLDLDGAEQDALIPIGEIRTRVAQVIADEFGLEAHPNEALVTAVAVDGREFDIQARDFKPGHDATLPVSVIDYLDKGQVINAIKELRSIRRGLSLSEAKNLVDDYRANR